MPSARSPVPARRQDGVQQRAGSRQFALRDEDLRAQQTELPWPPGRSVGLRQAQALTGERLGAWEVAAQYREAAGCQGLSKVTIGWDAGGSDEEREKNSNSRHAQAANGASVAPHDVVFDPSGGCTAAHVGPKLHAHHRQRARAG